MIALSVNLNKIALIRNSRDTSNPDLPEHAGMVIAAGADGITVHPRPDQRHIRASDCFDLAALLHTGAHSPDVAGNSARRIEFNIEGNPFAGPRASEREGVSDYPGFMQLVAAIKPDQCTLVPDSDSQLTSDHGFDLTVDGDRVAPLIESLHGMGVRVSLFMDADPQQIKLARAVGTDRIELYTEPYAEAFKAGHEVDAVLKKFRDAAELAAELGLGVNAGHDLDLHNLPLFAREIPALLEVSIGHALTVDAIRMGMAQAVAAYQHALGK